MLHGAMELRGGLTGSCLLYFQVLQYFLHELRLVVVALVNVQLSWDFEVAEDIAYGDIYHG
jgi:hypothetical protein